MYEFRCTVCGHKAERLMPVGKIPPCSLCGGVTEKIWTGKMNNVIPDDIPGGRVIENLGDEPVVVYSKTELKRELRNRGLREMVRHAPPPGSDRSDHTSNWAAVGPEGLQKAKELLEAHAERNRRPTASEVAGVTVEAEIRQHNPDARPARFEGGHIIDPDGELS